MMFSYSFEDFSKKTTIEKNNTKLIVKNGWSDQQYLEMDVKYFDL